MIDIIPQTSGIYTIRCVANNKAYIGSARNLRTRWKKHTYNLRKNTHHNCHLQRAWNRYGADSFVFSVIEECDVANLWEREQHYLDTLKPFDDNGFNISADSKSPTGGRKLTPEHVEKVASAHRGRKRSPEACARIGAAGRGRIITEETREKMRVGQIGRKHSLETIEKIRSLATGREASPETRAKLAAIRKERPGIKHKPESIEKCRLAKCHYTYTITSPSGEIHVVDNLVQFAALMGLCYTALLKVSKGIFQQHRGWKAQRKRKE